jgi:hypothetical protein
LNRSSSRSALHERDRLPATGLGGLRHRARTTANLALGVGVVDPVVEAAPLEGVVDLAGAVGGEHHHRRRRRADGADLGDGDLEVGQHLEQEGLELLVGAVQLVDQQHRRPRSGVGSIAWSSGRARKRLAVEEVVDVSARSPRRPRRADLAASARE